MPLVLKTFKTSREIAIIAYIPLYPHGPRHTHTLEVCSSGSHAGPSWNPPPRPSCQHPLHTLLLTPPPAPQLPPQPPPPPPGRSSGTS